MHHTTPGEHSVEAVLERQARRQEVESAVTQHIEQGRTACFTLLDVAKQYIVAEMTQLRGRRIHGAAVRNAEHSRQEALRAGTARRTDSSLNLADPPGVPRTGSTTENGGGYAGSYADAGYTMEELREMLSGGDGDISQTAEGSRLSVQLLEEREKQVRQKATSPLQTPLLQVFGYYTIECRQLHLHIDDGWWICAADKSASARTRFQGADPHCAACRESTGSYPLQDLQLPKSPRRGRKNIP